MVRCLISLRSCFGITVIMVWFKEGGSFPWKNKLLIAKDKSLPTMCQQVWKKFAPKPTGPRALWGFVEKKASLISSLVNSSRREKESSLIITGVMKLRSIDIGVLIVVVNRSLNKWTMVDEISSGVVIQTSPEILSCKCERWSAFFHFIVKESIVPIALG